MVHYNPDHQQDQDSPAANHQTEANHDQDKGDPLGIAREFIKSAGGRLTQGGDIEGVQGINETDLADQGKHQTNPEDRKIEFQGSEDDQDHSGQSKRQSTFSAVACPSVQPVRS